MSSKGELSLEKDITSSPATRRFDVNVEMRGEYLRFLDTKGLTPKRLPYKKYLEYRHQALPKERQILRDYIKGKEAPEAYKKRKKHKYKRTKLPPYNLAKKEGYRYSASK